ncbi:MAG: hypothetical protein Kow0092_13490 [Deferrisomatales bacterium]
MRTNIVIDDELLRTAMRLTHARTKREVVDLALRRLVQLERQREALSLEGTVEWEGDLEASRRSRLSVDED